LTLKPIDAAPAAEPARSGWVARFRSPLNDLTAREWVRATKSVILQRGLGARHPDTKYETRHPCPFSYSDAQNLITFFTRRGDSVLDPFAGIASTLKACALSKRLGTGIELNEEYCDWSQERLRDEVPPAQLAQYPQRILRGDARAVVGILKEDAFDFILTSPPYWRILSKPPDSKASQSAALRNGTLAYGDDPRDFASIERYEDFVPQMAEFLLSLRRVLGPRRYLAAIVADFRDGAVLHSYQADLIIAIREQQRQQPFPRQLVLQGISVLVQNQKRLYPYGYPTAYVPNIHHHYILIYRNIVS
jgi:DNA modification methylase